MSKSSVLLSMEDITKSFPGVKALDRAQLRVEAGSVHALMGENGAGKSTLMKCLFGINKKDGGRILLEGKEVEFRSPKDALTHGVAMVQQELSQALTRSVKDNMWLGRFPYISKYLPLVSERKMDKMTEEVFRELGISIDPSEKMKNLSVAKRQLVEIARAVSYGAKVIVFDEPTSSLTDRECELLFNIIKDLRNKGCGIIYISHKMSEILQISDYVTVMRDGKYIATEHKSRLTTDKIISLMVGRELTDRYPKRTPEHGDMLLEVRNLSGENSVLKNASLTLKRGEILGVAGLDGSGRTELLETIFGVRKRRGGEVLLDGVPVRNKNPEGAKRAGFALLTEERRASGIFGILNIRDNMTISAIKKYRKLRILRNKLLNEATDRCIKSMRIKTPSRLTKIRSLSGGNQQKVILGRWLLTEPRVLMLDEPTRGVDVGAKYEIYSLITKLAEDGRGIIIVSSEMPELMGICDRIIVMSDGVVAGAVDARSTSQEEIMTLASKNL